MMVIIILFIFIIFWLYSLLLLYRVQVKIFIRHLSYAIRGGLLILFFNGPLSHLFWCLLCFSFSCRGSLEPLLLLSSSLLCLCLCRCLRDRVRSAGLLLCICRASSLLVCRCGGLSEGGCAGLSSFRAQFISCFATDEDSQQRIVCLYGLRYNYPEPIEMMGWLYWS